MKPYITAGLMWIISFLFIGCGADVTQVAVTVEFEVANSVASTIEAMPTATLYATYTPYPTLTLLPSLTPLPTYTPQETFTPLPTYTPYPTVTAEPTATETATPLPPATLVSFQPTAAPAISDINALVLTTVNTTLASVDRLEGLLVPIDLSPGSLITYDYRVDCVAFVNTYDSIAQSPVFDVSTANSTAQGAYSMYREAVSKSSDPEFVNWVNTCRAAISSQGDTNLAPGMFNRSNMKVLLASMRDLLHLAINALSG